MTDLPRRRHPNYEILQRIGEGEIATVYRAHDSARNRDVAIKELQNRFRDDPGQYEPFWKLARSLVGLEHDHLVSVHEVDQDRGWIVMELMQGGLDAKLDEGPLKPALVRGILRQGLEALRFLGQRNLIHGAVKPANLLIDNRGRVKLGDASCVVGDGPVSVHAPRGSTYATRYLAPERLNPRFGPIGPGTDLYGLGLSAYELLVGPAFATLFPQPEARAIAEANDESGACCRWLASPSESLPPIRTIDPSIPEDLARVVDRLVLKTVADRYPDAASALGDLVDRPILPIDPPATTSPPPVGAMEPAHPLAEPSYLDPIAEAARPDGPRRLSKSSLILIPALLLVIIVPAALALWSHLAREPVAIMPVQETTKFRTGPIKVAKPGTEVGPGSAGSMENVPVVPTTTERPKVPEETPAVKNATTRPVALALPPDLTLKSTNLSLVLIPSGTFVMGSPEGDGDPNEHPRHEVRLTRPFYLGRTEVTQAQYRDVMGLNPSYFSRTGGGARRIAGQETDAHPVEMVGHADAEEFCRRLASREGLPEGSLRLPTEAEWEYAAKANADRAPEMGDALGPMAWFDKNSRDQTHPVGQKQPNGFRLHDMAGNVSEWCGDWYSEVYPDAPQRDPNGPDKPEAIPMRVLRGGNWTSSVRSCRPTDRSAAPPDEPINFSGFRVVLEVEAAKRLLTHVP